MTGRADRATFAKRWFTLRDRTGRPMLAVRLETASGNVLVRTANRPKGGLITLTPDEARAVAAALTAAAQPHD